MVYLEELEGLLQAQAQAHLVEPMQNYMKNHFAFYGVQTPTRRKIVKDFVAKQGLPSKENYPKLVLSMMQHQKREMNYCAIDIALRCQKIYLHEDDLPFIHELIATRSWWDSVDAIAPHLLGRYLLKFPHKVDECIKFYLSNNNMWWHRSAILFQLGYKKQTNVELLFSLCKHFGSSQEFFIQKAIGWALREYTRVDATLVYNFVDTHDLSKLSKREACKHRK